MTLLSYDSNDSYARVVFIGSFDCVSVDHYVGGKSEEVIRVAPML
jgi:hypothetical protein